MLDPHAETTERVIVGFLFFGQFLLFGFLERNIDVGVVFLVALIAAIGIGSDLLPKLEPLGSRVLSSF